MRRFVLGVLLPFFGTIPALGAADLDFDSGAAASVWTGFYGGVSGSYGFGDAGSTLNLIYRGALFSVPPESPSFYKTGRDGFLGGFQFGYNYRIDRLVIGPQIDVSFGSLRAQSGLSGISGGAQTHPFASSQNSTIDRFSTLRQKAGYLATDGLLLYGAAGLAMAGMNTGSTLNFFDGSDYVGGRATTRVGWTAGAGVEYAFAKNWRMTLEYLHYDLGAASTDSYRSLMTAYHTQSDVTNAGDMIRVGINYRLGDIASDPGEGYEAAPSIFSGLTYAFGTRYWYSTGAMRYDLHDYAGTASNSRLGYTGLDANAGELFGRIDHPSGIYVKADLGAGAIGGGALTDEDFPPVVTPYSRTLSSQQNGGLSYATGDLGYMILKGDNFRLGPFVGIAYYHEQMNAYGCAQQASNPDVCPTVAPSTLTITENADWVAGRIGVAGEVTAPWYGLKLDLEGAWLPYGMLYADDTHWLRLNNGTASSLSGPILQSGQVHGFQFEGMLTLPITSSVDIGIGARYWYFNSHGSALFQPTGRVGAPQETDFASRRYGEFVQIGTHF